MSFNLWKKIKNISSPKMCYTIWELFLWIGRIFWDGRNSTLVKLDSLKTNQAWNMFQTHFCKGAEFEHYLPVSLWVCLSSTCASICLQTHENSALSLEISSEKDWYLCTFLTTPLFHIWKITSPGLYCSFRLWSLLGKEWTAVSQFFCMHKAPLVIIW